MDVLQIHPHPFLERDPAATGDLPNAGHSRHHAEPSALPRRALDGFVNGKWSRSDQRHVATQDVPELWKLIETCRTQPAADPGCARVVLQLEGGAVLYAQLTKLRLHCVSALLHGSQLKNSKAASAHAFA